MQGVTTVSEAKKFNWERSYQLMRDAYTTLPNLYKLPFQNLYLYIDWKAFLKAFTDVYAMLTTLSTQNPQR